MLFRRIILLTILLNWGSFIFPCLAKSDFNSSPNTNQNSVFIEQVYLLEDNSNKKTIFDIAAIEGDSSFQKIDLESIDRFSLGLSKSSWWLRLHLNKVAITSLNYLIIDYSLLDTAVLYTQNLEGDFMMQTCGISYSNMFMKWSTRVPVFSLNNLPSNSVVYLNIKSKSPILLPLSIKEEGEYMFFEITSNILFGFFGGIMFIVLCYNLIFYLSTKEIIYFHYFIHILTISMVLINYFGFSYLYVWNKDFMWINITFPASILLAAITMANFIRQFLNTKINFPIIDTLFLFIIVIYGILFLLLPFIPVSVVYLLLAPGSSILMILLITTLIRSYKKDFAPASYMIIGWLFLFVGILSLVGKTFGIIPHNTFTALFILVGVATEVIMFTIGIGHRYRWLKCEKQIVVSNLKEKYKELEILREEIARFMTDDSSKNHNLITISKDEINSYLLNELSKRELEVIYLVAKGLSNKDIAEQLFISTNTVRAHMRNMYDKLDVKNRTAAVFKANQLRLIDR